MAQSKRAIHDSVSNIRKQVPGNIFATAGSACVLEWPWKIDHASSLDREDKIFLACSSQVVSKSELNSSNVCTANFLSLGWGGKKTSCLNHIQLQEVQLNKDISLILIPVELLHKQRRLSWLRKNEFLSDRPQPCSKSRPDNNCKLYCHVVREIGPGDTFDLQCYLLKVDENGSYYLQVHGNKAELKSLKDFDRYEYPVGSVILNDTSEVVGFLAFGEKDEILPLFIFPEDQQGNEHVPHDKLTVDLPKDVDSTEVTDGCNENGERLELAQKEAQKTAIKSQEDDMSSDNNLNTICAMENVANNSPSDSSNSSEDSNILAEVTDQQNFETCLQDQDKDLLTNTEIPSDIMRLMIENLRLSDSRQRSGPIEMSFSSLNSGGPGIQIGGANNKEEFCPILPPLRGNERPSLQGPRDSAETNPDTDDAREANKRPVQRSQSEQNAESLSQAKKSLFKVHSVVEYRSSSGPLVESVILGNVYVMDILKRRLDTSYYKNVQNWQHLAHRQNVPTDMIMKLTGQSPASRSESLFELLETRNPDLTIGTLKFHLNCLKNMGNVAKCISDLEDHKKIDEALQKAILPGKFFILLDHKQDEHWKNLGLSLGIDHKDLTGIMTSCAAQHKNPAQELIHYLCGKDPNMPITEFKKFFDCTDTGINRMDIIKKLDSQPGLKTVTDLQDNLELMREVTCMLNNADNSQKKNYLDLASKCGISPEVYRSIQPPCSESPTKQVLEDIVGRKPSYTVQELFTDLQAMDRSDVVEAICRHFVEL